MLRNYVLIAYKVFMRRKLFTAINLACIVLTLIVLVVATALLEALFFPSGVEGKSARFLQIYTMHSESRDASTQRSGGLGYKMIQRELEPMQGVERVSAFTTPTPVSVYQDGQVSELQLRRVDADYWKILDFKLLAGRLPVEDDERLGRMVAVLNASSAHRLFGAGAGAALGRTVSAGGQTFSVIAVVADVLHLNAYADMWAPVTTFPSTQYRDELTGNFAAMLLAREAADLPAIQREVARIASRYVSEDPSRFAVTRFPADTKPDMMARQLFGTNRDADPGTTKMAALIGAAMLLFMLLPALNLVNLNMGRIAERSAEIGVRKAFGATSFQLIGQLVVENVLLCLAGGLLGLAGARVVLWWLAETQLIPYLDVGINLPVFACGMLLAFLFGLLSGALPAWKMSRLDPVHALKGNA